MKLTRDAEKQEWPEHLEPVRSIRGWLSAAQAQLLYDYAAAVRDACVVEIGSYRGRSTAALALGAIAGGGAPVFAIEPHEEFHGPLGGEFGPEDRAAFFRNMLKFDLYRQVRLVNLPSTVVARGWERPVGLLWIDGDHTFDAVRADFISWKPHLVPGAIVAFDDAATPGLGPDRVVAEAQTEHGFVEVARVEKVVALQAPRDR